MRHTSSNLRSSAAKVRLGTWLGQTWKSGENARDDQVAHEQIVGIFEGRAAKARKLGIEAEAKMEENRTRLRGENLELLVGREEAKGLGRGERCRNGGPIMSTEQR